jgi:hypothetical protein
MAGMDVIGWLLDGDPAIRWQAMRDLTGAEPAAIAVERTAPCACSKDYASTSVPSLPRRRSRMRAVAKRRISSSVACFAGARRARSCCPRS